MIYFFAADPELPRDPLSFVEVVSKLGVENGRVLADFPASWVKVASKGLASHLSPLQFKRVEERLRDLRVDGTMLLPVDIPYDESAEWVTNAVGCSESFRIVILTQPVPSTLCPTNAMTAEALLSHRPPEWDVPRDGRFPATVPATVAMLAPMIRIGSAVLIMDPFFDPTRSEHRRLFEALAAVANDRTFEVHCEAKVFGGRLSIPTSRWKATCERHLGHRQSSGPSRVVRWKRQLGGARPHERWLVTERGGALLDRGLYLHANGSNKYSLLSRTRARALYQDYCEAGRTDTRLHEFDLVDVVQLQ